jgi:hypothetical protein
VSNAKMPNGYYRVEIESPGWARLVRFLWQGKLFCNGDAWNRFGPTYLFCGCVKGTPANFTITYASWLVDDVWEIGKDKYRGTMKLGPFEVFFTLTKKRENRRDRFRDDRRIAPAVYELPVDEDDRRRSYGRRVTDWR